MIVHERRSELTSDVIKVSDFVHKESLVEDYPLTLLLSCCVERELGCGSDHTSVDSMFGEHVSKQDDIWKARWTLLPS